MTGSEVAAQAGVIGLGVFALHAFFRGVETSWPHTYFAITDVSAQRLASSPWRYLMFRVIPVYAVAFFVAGSLKRADAPFLWAPLTIAIVHAGMTNGRAAVTIARRGSAAFGFWPTIVGHAAAALMSITVVVLALLSVHVDQALLLLPSAEEVSATLWTALVAAVLGAYIVRVSTRQAITAEKLAAKSRRTISEHLWSVAGQAALQNGAEPSLIRAIMLVENLQRPPWVRSLENIKARLGWTGTYGIMQVRGSRLIEDEESIRIACADHLRGATPTRNQHGPDGGSVAGFVTRHNPDPAFVDMVRQVYFQLEHDTHRAK